MLTRQTSKDPAFREERTANLLKALEERRILTLVIEAASSCNLKCTFCDAHSGRAPAFKEQSGVMTSSAWHKVLADIREYVAARGVIDMVQFHGNGEPLLNKRLASMISSLVQEQLAVKVRVITNGVLLTPEKLSELADAGLNEIHVSLDSTDGDKYLQVKKGDYAFRVVDNLDKAVQIVRSRKDVELYIKYFSEETSNAYGIDRNDHRSVVERFYRHADGSPFVHLKEQPLVDVGIGMIESKSFYASPCEVPFYLLYIMHSGKVSACCSDVFNGMTIGRLTSTQETKQPTMSLLEIVDSRRLYEIRKKHLDSRANEIRLCAGCSNRTQVDLSKLSADTIAHIGQWIRQGTDADIDLAPQQLA